MNSGRIVLFLVSATFSFAAGSAGAIESFDTTSASAYASKSDQVQPLKRKMEYMDRGAVAINQGRVDGEYQVYIGWRLLATDPDGVAFDVYCRYPGKEPLKLNAELITRTTDFVVVSPKPIPANVRFFVLPVIDGEQGDPARAAMPEEPLPYIGVKLDRIKQHIASDCSVADLDGDGQYELIVKWDPENAKDNAQSGDTDNVYIDAYKLDGTRLWRIDLGPNIRAGAHYTQFMVYDLDCDGMAELVCKTADGTVDGVGKVIGDRKKVWRNNDGYILEGPEFLTCFGGTTGAAISTVDYVPPRHPDTLEPTGDQLKAVWGDNYGNRCDRFLACVAYLDGRHPSVIMCRGYYTRTVLAAWDLVDGELQSRWIFDSDSEGGKWAGQGNHNLSVADVDADGRDEIMFGAMCVDDDGSGLYSTEMGHGDAAHLTDLNPDRAGLENWSCHEEVPYGASLRDAKTGEVIMRWEGSRDTGRACAANIDPRHPGCELWASAGCPLYSATGTVITDRYRLPVNFVLNWDDDDLQELLDGTAISKYNWKTGKLETLLDASQYDCASNNGTKATPCLSADLFGDYREEVVWRTVDSDELRIFTTTIPAKRRLVTLMQDPQYRLSVAWQNVGYNQPPHTSFYMGDGMKEPPHANIEVIKTTRR